MGEAWSWIREALLAGGLIAVLIFRSCIDDGVMATDGGHRI